MILLDVYYLENRIINNIPISNVEICVGGMFGISFSEIKVQIDSSNTGLSSNLITNLNNMKLVIKFEGTEITIGQCRMKSYDFMETENGLLCSEIVWVYNTTAIATATIKKINTPKINWKRCGF